MFPASPGYRGLPRSGCVALTHWRVLWPTHAQGGANAGHTIYDAAGKKYALHLVPSGILNPGAQCVIGNGVVVHVPGLFAEIDALEAAGVKACHAAGALCTSKPDLAVASADGWSHSGVRPRAPAF